MAGSVFSQRPPRKLRSAKARPTAPGVCVLRRRARAGGGRGCEEGCDDADGCEGDADADGVGHGAEHRPEDGAEDGGAECRADQLATAVPGGGDRQPGERAGPGDRARGPLDEPCEAERPWPLGGGEGEAGEGEEDEPGDDGELRAESRGGEPAGDRAEHRAGAERADEQPGAGLREPELVGVAGHERRERPKQHRVDKHDHTDQKKKPAHPTLPTRRRPLNQASGAAERARSRPTQLQGSRANQAAPALNQASERC